MGRKCEVPSQFSYAREDFDDKAWEIVDLPHDSVVNSTYSKSEDNNHGSFVRRVVWYRKHFALPSDWTISSSSSPSSPSSSLSAIFVEFDAIFHVADIWVNNKHLGTWRSGYLPVRVRIDEILAATNRGGNNEENVIVVRADPTFGSGHWYEGGGIYRSTRLIRTSRVFVVADSLFSPPDVLAFSPVLTLRNEGKEAAAVSTRFTLRPAARWHGQGGEEVKSGETDTKILVQTQSNVVSVAAGAEAIVNSPKADLPSTVAYWSIEKPLMYELTAEVFDMDVSNTTAIDSVMVYVSFRKTTFDAENGFLINNERRWLHGFCHHEDFAGVGVAISDRINLFRAQALRAVGGNSWRMSHNPYKPSTYDLLDRLGVVVWDEARDYAEWYVEDMAAMVRRDRNHPSVAIWSFCNEIECHQDYNDTVTGKLFREAARAQDSTRPVAYNWVKESSDIVDDSVDVHGLSHSPADIFNSYHIQHPARPIVSSECCSCEIQRGETEKTGGDVYFPGFDGECLQKELSWSEDEKFDAGTMGIWTLFDYYGEPGGWPHISSSFGQFDLGGIPKSHAYWYRAWWGCSGSASNSTGTPSCFVTHIAEQWDRPLPPPSLHIISNAEFVEVLLEDGTSLGTKKMPLRGYVKYSLTGVIKNGQLGTVTANGKNADGKIVSTHVFHPSSGKAAGVELVLDAPSLLTGTGSTVLLDGHDTALIRARVVDEDGYLVASATNKVHFRVVSGPGRLVGIGNGDPSSHESNQVATRSAYHGLVRAVVQASMDCVSPKSSLAVIDLEGGVRTQLCNTEDDDAANQIVLEASLEDLPSSAHFVLHIPVSADRSHDPINVAAGKPSVSRFLDHFH